MASSLAAVTAQATADDSLSVKVCFPGLVRCYNALTFKVTAYDGF